jgi:hypothetical protein
LLASSAITDASLFFSGARPFSCRNFSTTPVTYSVERSVMLNKSDEESDEEEDEEEDAAAPDIAEKS